MIFSCCLGYQFPDTGTRIKSVGCHGAFWNSSLPNLHCQSKYLSLRTDINAKNSAIRWLNTN